LREECRPRVFENGMLRKKLCNEEIHGLYFELYIFEVINQEDEIGRA